MELLCSVGEPPELGKFILLYQLERFVVNFGWLVRKWLEGC